MYSHVKRNGQLFLCCFDKSSEIWSGGEMAGGRTRHVDSKQNYAKQNKAEEKKAQK